MPVTDTHIKHCLLFLFDSGHKAAEAHRQLVQTYGQDAPHYNTCASWFQRFKSGDRSIEDKERSGRPTEVDRDELLSVVQDNRRISSRQIAAHIGCSKSAVEAILRDLGFHKKFGQWIPHHLTPDQREQRISICYSHLLNPINDYLRQIITGDEKWVLYANHSRKRQWVRNGEEPEAEVKVDPHQRKVMLCIFWDMEGILFWELLPPNTTVTAEVFCNQLEKLRQAKQQKRPNWAKEKSAVRLLVNNARPHVAKITRQKLEKFRWHLMAHPPYSPDLSPSDYHLFRALANDFKEKQFDDYDDIKLGLETFFNHLPKEFFARGIADLAQRWETVIDNNGDYIID